jgi:hypothetical protein
MDLNIGIGGEAMAAYASWPLLKLCLKPAKKIVWKNTCLIRPGQVIVCIIPCRIKHTQTYTITQNPWFHVHNIDEHLIYRPTVTMASKTHGLKYTLPVAMVSLSGTPTLHTCRPMQLQTHGSMYTHIHAIIPETTEKHWRVQNHHLYYEL